MFILRSGSTSTLRSARLEVLPSPQRLVKASGQEKEEVAAKLSAHKKFLLREFEVIPKDPANRAGSARI